MRLKTIAKSNNWSSRLLIVDIFFDISFFCETMNSNFLSFNNVSLLDEFSKYYRCRKINAVIEKNCIAIFKWRQNLSRHKKKFYQNLFIKFVHIIENWQRRKNTHVISNIQNNSKTFSLEFIDFFFVALKSFEQIMQFLTFDSMIEKVQFKFHKRSSSQFLSNTTTKKMSKSNEISTFVLHHFFEFTRRITFMKLFIWTINFVSYDRQIAIKRNFFTTQFISNAFLKSISVINASNSQQIWTNNDELFMYEIKSFKQDLVELKTLQWLILTIQKKFYRIYETFLTRWKITTRYKKTCFFVSQAWKFSNSLNLMILFSCDDRFKSNSFRAWYSNVNHETLIVRVLIWYVKKSRTNFDLDVFLKCELYKSMNASYLCHYEHCITHVCFEFSHINQNRQNCVRRAQFLRNEKKFISKHCEMHEFSCMMHVNVFDHCFHRQTC